MLNSLKNKNKLGFSLFEVVLTMSIIAIFVAACSNVFTQRHKKRILSPLHGHYECYRKDDGNVYERKFEGDVEVLSESLIENGACEYKPPIGASYIVIAAVAGGGYGGETFGGSAGRYTNIFISSSDHTLKIEPGLAAEETDFRGGTTKVTDLGTVLEPDDNEIITLLGGMSDSSNRIAFKECMVAYTRFGCGVAPACEINESWTNSSGEEEGAVIVSYCVKDSDFAQMEDPSVRNITIPFKTTIDETLDIPAGVDGFYDKCRGVVGSYSANLANRDTRVEAWGNGGNIKGTNNTLFSIYSKMGSPATPEDRALLANGLVSYDYTKLMCKSKGDFLGAEYTTLFRINLRLDGNYTEDIEESNMDGYLNSLNLKGGIFTKDEFGRRESSGQGGAKNAKGGNGSLLILW